VPWYVDTRVLFYRTDLLARAGVSAPPATWAEWTDAMHKVKALGGPTKWAIVLPLDEWAQPVIFAFQAGSPLLKDGGRFGAFEEPAFRRAFEFYVRLFRDGLAPALANTQIANVYQEFAAGTFAMYITGPWNIGEFRSRLPDSLQNAWATAPLPGPNGPGQSIAGGASLVVYRASKHKAEAWKLVEFLSSREQELRFYALTGDLPARTDAWRDTSLSNDRHARAFYDQLQRVEPLPKVPEWELIATRIAAAAEQVARGRATTDVALAALDRDVNQMLEKRRWMLARHGVQAAARAMTPTGAR
jgi:multiple sugar transport system substrate-binding protein